MRKRLIIALAAVLVLIPVGLLGFWMYGAPDRPASLPKDELAKLQLFSRGFAKSRGNTRSGFGKNTYNVTCTVQNNTDYELATVTVEVQVLDEAGNPNYRQDVTFESFTDNYNDFVGTLLPSGHAESAKVEELPASVNDSTVRGYWMVVKSATGYRNPRDMTKLGHVLAVMARAKLPDIERMLSSYPSRLKAGQEESNSMPVHIAAAQNDQAVLAVLHSRGANLDQKNTRTGAYPIHMAAGRNSTETLQYLLDNGADPNVTDRQLNTPLHWAANVGSVDTLKMLLAKGANPSLLNKSEQTPLLLAAWSNQAQVVKPLLDAGADANAIYWRTGSAVSLFAGRGNLDAVKMLVEHGANPNQGRSMDNWNALHSAAYNGDPELVEYLVEHGANPGIKTRNYTALQIAEGNGRTEAAEILRGKG